MGKRLFLRFWRATMCFCIWCHFSSARPFGLIIKKVCKRLQIFWQKHLGTWLKIRVHSDQYSRAKTWFSAFLTGVPQVWENSVTLDERATWLITTKPLLTTWTILAHHGPMASPASWPHSAARPMARVYLSACSPSSRWAISPGYLESC